MRLRFRRQLLAIVGIVAAVLAVAGFETNALRRLELSTVDTRFSVRGTRPHRDVAVVKIDDKTLDARMGPGRDPRTHLLQRAQYPFPRSFHARVIDALRRDGARVIAYDVQFTEPTQAREDAALLDAAFRARPVVFAATKVSAGGATDVFGGPEAQRQVGARVGSVNFVLDPGAVYRRVPFAVEGLQHFAVVAAELADHRRLRAADLGSSTPLIDFAGPPGTIESVPFYKVLRGEFRPGTFRGKIVVVGATDAVLQDVHATSVSGDVFMSGPEIEANAIATVRAGAPLRTVGSGITVGLIAVLALLIPLATTRIGPLRAQLLSVAIGAAYAVGAQVAFDHGKVLPVVYPLGGLALGSTGSLAVHYLLAAFAREQARNTFARFVPESVADKLLALTDDDPRLGGVRTVGTVMFTDIRGFTTFSESRAPEEVIDVLNRYMDEMSEAVLDHGGTLVNYIGDGIMAVWGAPLEQADHADLALMSGREMLEERLPKVNAWLCENGADEGFRIGIGLHSGPLVAGNIGSMRHMQYTAIGDTCNAASRIEGLTKGSGYDLLMSHATYELLVLEPEDAEFIGEMAIRGRSEKIRLYGLLSD